MKYIIILLAFLFISCENNQTITSTSLTKIFFADDDNGWIVGTNGAVYRSVNSGHNWEDINIRTDVELTDVHFVNPQKGFVIGDKGLLLSTNDGGTNFKRYKFDYSDVFNAIDFYDENNGIIVGNFGAIYTSSNSGQNWNKIDIGNDLKQHLRAVKYTSENDIWISGDYQGSLNDSIDDSFAMIYHSSDKGQTWTEFLKRNDLTYRRIYSTDIEQNANYLYISANASILRINLDDNSLLFSDFYLPESPNSYHSNMQFRAITKRGDEVWTAGKYASSRGAIYSSSIFTKDWEVKFTANKGYIDENIPASDKYIAFSDILFVKNRFIAVGNGTDILQSSDGESWSFKSIK